MGIAENNSHNRQMLIYTKKTATQIVILHFPVYQSIASASMCYTQKIR